MLGFAEQLEFLERLSRDEIRRHYEGAPASKPSPPRSKDARSDTKAPRRDSTVTSLFLRAAMSTADFYIENCCTDGIPMWDTGAPNLHRLGDYLDKPADPYNQWEPVDSSAAAIAAQGFLRLGNYLCRLGKRAQGANYRQAAFTLARTLLSEPYLSTNPRHQGLLLHSVYHRPNGWDYIARGQKVPNGESSMWGDYHVRELAVLLLREVRGEPYSTFFGVPNQPS